MTAGHYTAAVWRWLAATAIVMCLACGDDPTSAVPECGTGIMLETVDTIQGALTEDDARFAGAFVDYYTLRLSGPDSSRVALSMSSSEVDPLLLVFNVDEQTAEPVFDSIGEPPGAEETAALTRRFGVGCHLFGASSWHPDSTGAYTISVDTTAP